jgi:ribosome-associated toxin RatA of RatAB toxin-antitoxin module
MPTVNETTVIQASPEKVFDFISDPKRAPIFIPGLNRISNLSSPEPKVGRTWEWELNWFGVVLSGQTECRQLDPPRVYQFETLTGAKSCWTYRCEPQNNQTRLNLEVQYETPQNLIAKVAAEPVLEKMNRHRAEETLANIKALLEP